MSYNIAFDQIGVTYGDFKALDNISMTLDSGKIYGLIGRNGAGKSTLLSLLASYMEPTSGSITVGGEKPFENANLMSKITFVHQTNYSEETETVKGMLESAERYRPNFDRQYADQLVELFKLPLKTQMKQLSNGMQSALNVTIGLANRTPITIFDEAYVGMDAPTREIFYKQLLEDHAEHPRTIILSTHLVSEMDYLFERVIIINRGKLITYMPIDELIEQGLSVTGAIQEVDAFVRDMKQLSTQQLGGTKSVMIYGELTDMMRREATQRGLEIGPVSLQDLFIHLTNEEG